MVSSTQVIEKNPSKILIVDRAATSRVPLSQIMETNGFQVEEARSAGEALNALKMEHFEGVFFHFPLNHSNDLHLMGSARRLSPEMLIVVQDDFPEVERTIAAIKAGVADYLTGPNNTQEVAEALIAALGRHNERVGRLSHHISQALQAYFGVSGSQPEATHKTGIEMGSTLTVGNLRLVQLTRTLTTLGAEKFFVKLTKGESDVLAVLMDHQGEATSCRTIVREAWGYDMLNIEAKSVIRPHISRLRRKLSNTPIDATTITTIRGLGYVFVPDYLTTTPSDGRSD